MLLSLEQTLYIIISLYGWILFNHDISWPHTIDLGQQVSVAHRFAPRVRRRAPRASACEKTRFMAAHRSHVWGLFEELTKGQLLEVRKGQANWKMLFSCLGVALYSVWIHMECACLDGGRGLEKRTVPRRPCQDTVLLMVEAELPSGLPTAKELLHWGGENRRGVVTEVNHRALKA